MGKIIHFLADNTGNIVSAKKTADYIVSSGRKTSSDTTDNYRKVVLSMDPVMPFNEYKGIEHYNIVEWLIRKAKRKQ
jgi:hypothetical protein